MAMRSLLISTYYPPEHGGIAHYMASVAEALGPEHVCCLTSVRAPALGAKRGDGVRVYRRPRAFAAAKITQAVSVAASIGEIVLRERPQAVQLATTTSEGYFGLWLRRWLGLPFVIYAHGNEVLQAIQSSWPLPRRALVSADRVLANSRFTASLVRDAGVAPERVEIVHPGCDIESFHPTERDESLCRRLLGERRAGPILLSVGGLVPRKGQDMVIHALPKLLKRYPDLVYLIVGEGRHRRTLETLIAQTGVGDRVVLTGEVRDVPLQQIYALCDLFVMPSREQLDLCDVEGFGMVYLEANACGKAVIGGRSGGIADAIIDGQTGLLVDPHSPEAIAEALDQLLSNRTLASQMGAHGRARIAREFTWTQVAARIQGILSTLTVTA
jgi:phosphatidylinositol alpha-1,6-mannosyltransferase